LARHQLADLVGVREPAAEEPGEEGHLGTDRERLRRLPFDRLDVLVPGGRVVRVGRVRRRFGARPLDDDLGGHLDRHYTRPTAYQALASSVNGPSGEPSCLRSSSRRRSRFSSSSAATNAPDGPVVDRNGVQKSSKSSYVVSISSKPRSTS